MSYKVVTEPHTCELPFAGDFELGIEIQCTAPRLSGGVLGPCHFTYVRSAAGWWWDRYPVWAEKDWGW